ncbi:MAG: hypothetical protein K1X79_07765 [Oligoflexia bacterium]|nr:hypothetical protein [Oligoflexia bacterium]
MSKRKVRASLLLKTLTCVVSIGIFFGVLRLATLGPVSIGLIVFLVVFWYVAIEGGALPAYLNHLAEKHASSNDRAINSIWFVNVEAQREHELSDFAKKTEDNPTLR